MFASLKSFLFGENTNRRPIRRSVRLGMETLEAREVPTTCVDLTHHLPLLQGKDYSQLVVCSCTLGANDTSTVDDYLLESSSPSNYGGFSRTGTAHLHKDGSRVYVTDDLNLAQEGAYSGHYKVSFRKNTNDVLIDSHVTYDVYNANVASINGTLGSVTGINHQETPRKLLTIFHDERLAAATPGSFWATINWGDTVTTLAEINVVGDRVDVYGSHEYDWNETADKRKFRDFDITITLCEDAGYLAPNTKFCSMPKTITDAQKDQISVGGMAVYKMKAHIASNWWVDHYGDKTENVMSALDSAWAAIAADKKDGTADKWTKLTLDAVSNQKMLISTITAVLARNPKSDSTVWLGIMQEALRKASRDDRSLGEIAFDIALNKLVASLEANLAGVAAELPGLTSLSTTSGAAGLDPTVQKSALAAAKSISTRVLLARYLKAEMNTINPSFVPGRAPVDNATLTAANMDLVLKATTGPALDPANAGIANWQALETLTSQRINRTVTFESERTGKDLAAALAALADGSTGIIHSAATTAKPNGALESFVKLDGQVFILDARLGTFATLNAATMYQMLNTTE
jgi:hypothetical protein